jgi:hypothetical protein
MIMIKSDILSLEARAAVHEVLLLNMLMAIYREPEGGTERAELVLESATAFWEKRAENAPAAERAHAKAGKHYMNDLVKKFGEHARFVMRH